MRSQWEAGLIPGEESHIEHLPRSSISSLEFADYAFETLDSVCFLWPRDPGWIRVYGGKLSTPGKIWLESS